MSEEEVNQLLKDENAEQYTGDTTLPRDPANVAIPDQTTFVPAYGVASMGEVEAARAELAGEG